tara:strand:- start:662 stop:1210 length:549 start_codon:yes stop_codon:yes gene_type:complete
MVAGSILPVALHKNKLHFLFGKENPMEDSAKGFSDFGGRADGNETPYDAAMREGGEELTGFLGDGDDIRTMIKKNGGVFPVTVGKYHAHIFVMDYDANLPKYYNQNHKFLWEKMDNKVLNDSKLFEKIEIRWFSLGDMKRYRKWFRPFYREIVDVFLSKQTEITEFVKTKSKKMHRKTLKSR